MNCLKNRWLVLFAGVVTQMVLGGVYAWSSFTPYLTENYSFSKGESGLIFGVMIISFTIMMIFAGKILQSRGPKMTASIGAILYGSGYILASFSGGSFPVILISLGILAGSGIGFGYVCPLASGIKWFPNHRGLVTGVAVAGFGGGAVLLSVISGFFLKRMDILPFFRYYGITASTILLLSAAFLAFPEKPKTSPENTKRVKIFQPAFYLLFTGLFFGTFAGLKVIGNLSMIIQDIGFNLRDGIFSISLFSIGNAAGRISWGALYDRFKTICAPLSLYALALSCLFLILSSSHIFLYLAVLMLGFSFGANFVVYAGIVSNYFGVESFSKVYPICFLSYGIAGLLGPGFGGLLADATGSYLYALMISFIILIFAGILFQYKLSIFSKKN